MNRLHILRATALGAALALAASSSHAQPMPAAETAPTTEKARLKVRNMPAGLLAYWLDPSHNPAPIQLQMSKSNGGGYNYSWTSDVDKMTRQPGNGNGPRGLKMPASIESIDAVDPQNVLQVKGTVAGIESLRKLVKELDVPVGNIEIEAQIWEIAPAEFARLPLNFRNASRSTAPFGDTSFGELAFAAPEDNTSSLTQQLQFWQTTERARLISAPRVTAIDGLAASLMSTETRRFNVNAMEYSKPEVEAPAEAPEDENAETVAPRIQTPEAEKPDDNWEWGRSLIQNQLGFNAMPVLHGDLIAVAFQVVFNNDVSQASTILRDGETLPVRLSSNSNKGWVRVALIKARIIRRAGDEVKAGR